MSNDTCEILRSRLKEHQNAVQVASSVLFRAKQDIKDKNSRINELERSLSVLENSSTASSNAGRAFGMPGAIVGGAVRLRIEIQRARLTDEVTTAKQQLADLENQVIAAEREFLSRQDLIEITRNQLNRTGCL